MTSQDRKDTNFEINLLPFISLLSVCISFLLLTAVWIHIGTIDVSQAYGPQRTEETEKTPQVEVHILDDQKVGIQIKDVESSHTTLKWSERLSRSSMIGSFAKIESEFPSVKTALIFPTGATSYDDLIMIMDALKKANINSIGVNPL